MANHPHLWLHHNYFFLKGLQWRKINKNSSIIGGHLIKKKKFSSAQTTNVSLFEMPCLFFSVIPVNKFSTGTLCWVALQSSSNVTLLKMEMLDDQRLGKMTLQTSSPWTMVNPHANIWHDQNHHGGPFVVLVKEECCCFFAPQFCGVAEVTK